MSLKISCAKGLVFSLACWEVEGPLRDGAVREVLDHWWCTLECMCLCLYTHILMHVCVPVYVMGRYVCLS